jgi:sugar-specific transcriptional regulator TrmB
MPKEQESRPVAFMDEFCNLLQQTNLFDSLEVRIVRAMLQLKPKQPRVTAAMIAKQAGLSVTNAYKYLYSLQLKGLVESSKSKNKIFWIGESSNPFPRMISMVAQDYLSKKKIFADLQSIYDSSIAPTKKIWGGEKIYEHYDNNHESRILFLFDIAKEEALLTVDRLFKDFALMEAVARASSRGVRVRIVTELAEPELVEKLKKVGAELRLGRAWPHIIVVDGSHGMTVDLGDHGIWFLNYTSDYKNRFEQVWEKSDNL